MIAHHPWPRPSHDLPDSFLHLRPIAMNWAFLAGGFILTVTTSVKSAMGIIQQCPTVWTQFGMPFMLLAVQTYHLLHHRFFFFYASDSHWHIIVCVFESCKATKYIHTSRPKQTLNESKSGLFPADRPVQSQVCLSYAEPQSRLRNAKARARRAQSQACLDYTEPQPRLREAKACAR